MAKRTLPKIGLADCGRKVLEASEKTLFLVQSVRTAVDWANDRSIPEESFRACVAKLREPLDECLAALLGD